MSRLVEQITFKKPIKHSDITLTEHVIYCWLPSNVGIHGKEMGNHLECTTCNIPYTDASQSILAYITSKRQTT